MTSKPIWFKFFIQDWKFSDTARKMNHEQKGIYLELLVDHAFDGSIPSDQEELRLIHHVSAETWEPFWEIVEPKFPINDDGRRRNPKMVDAMIHYKKSIDGGKKSAGIRKNKANPPSTPLQPPYNESATPLQHNANGEAATTQHPLNHIDIDLDKDKEKNKTGGVGGGNDSEARKRKSRDTLDKDWNEISRWYESLPQNQRNAIDQAIHGIKQTRKTKKLSQVARINLAKKLRQYDIQAVISACKIYSENNYHLEGKNEMYLYGIIRGEESKCRT